MTMISTAPTKDKTKIKEAIQQFVQGADSQDSNTLATVLHPESQQYYVGQEGLVRLPRTTYFNLIDQKKIGGTPRELDIESIDLNGNLAVARVKIWNDNARFENYFSLMKVEDEWQIISIILHMEVG